MEQIKDYLVCQIFDALVIDTATNSIVAKDKLASADIEISQEAKEVIGGANSQVLATIGGKRSLSVKLSEPVFSFETLAAQLGQDIITGSGTAFAMPKGYIVNAEKKITLDRVPIDKTLVFADPSITGTVTSESKEVTIAGADEGDNVLLKTYQYVTPETSKTINIDAKKFATAKRLVLETPVFDLEENKVAVLQWDFAKVKADGSVSFQTKTESEATSNEINFTVLSENGIQGVIRWIPVEDPVGAYTLVGENTKVGNNTIVGKKK